MHVWYLTGYCDCAQQTCSFLQVPLFLRQYVTSISAVPDRSAHAVTPTSHVVFFNLTSFDTFVHESAHAQDYATSNHQYGGPAWETAVAEDSCVADAYAKRDNVEAYAQAMVTFLYKLLLPHDSIVQGTATDCMSHQLTYINNSQAPGLQDFIRVRGLRKTFMRLAVCILLKTCLFLMGLRCVLAFAQLCA